MEARKLDVKALIAHRINLSTEKVEPIDVTDSKPFDYVKRLISDVSLNQNGRKFKIRDITTQVIGIVQKAIKKGGTAELIKIAERLLKEEVKVQQKVAHLVEVREGILVQSSIVDNDVKKFILCKAELLDYVDGQKFELANGYPLKRKIYRSVQITFTDDDTIDRILVYDTNNKSAKYWWDSFMELDQHWDDSYNTVTAFESIDKVLSKIKKDAPNDHMNLRNATIRYFRAKDEFDMDDYLENCIGDYQPFHGDKVNIDEIKTKIKALPANKDFDTNFQLVAKEITAKIKTTINLTADIDLTIKKDIEIDHYISPEKRKGIKYLLIKTDEGYDHFDKKQAK